MSQPHFQVLASEVRDELTGLGAIISEIKDFLEQSSEMLPPIIKNRVLGSQLHDFYTEIERIFRRIAIKVDGDFPRGDAWHSDLLDQVAIDIPNERVRVISPELKTQLYEYLRFRHLFRNIYGPHLQWDKLLALRQNVSALFEDFSGQIDAFLNFLTSL